MKSKLQQRREAHMKKKQNESSRGIWMLLAIFGVILLGLSILQQQTSAFYGKGYTLTGELDEAFANTHKSKYVPITYASGTYRRSRAGSNYRNYINRESTKKLRSSRNTPERKSNILSRNRYTGSTRSFSSRKDVYHQLARKRILDRRNEKQLFMKKYER